MKIKPAKRLVGTAAVPADKSISHRAAILAAMADGETRIDNYSTAGDCQTTLSCLEQFGVRVGRDQNSVTVHGAGKSGFKKPSEAVDCGNSGTTARLLAGVLAGQTFDSVLTGDESLRSRPMKRVIEPLSLMGSKIESVDGRLPLTIYGGPLKGIDYEMPVASAQVKSCLLLAGLLADGQTTVRESTPTRDHTERMLGWFGVDVDVDNDAASVNGGDTLRARGLSVPGDISSAAFFIIAGICLPGSDLCIPNAGLNPTRTDLLEILTALGADIELKEQTNIGNEPSGTIQVRGGLPASPREQPYRLSGSAIPGIIDELPILAVLGTQIDGGLEVRDAGELRLKESDRISSVVENLRRMGASVDDQADGFFVRKSKLAGAVVDSFRDHRIAMAFAVAGLLAEGETEIRGAECVEISFPGFFDVLAAVTGSDG